MHRGCDVPATCGTACVHWPVEPKKNSKKHVRIVSLRVLAESRYPQGKRRGRRTIDTTATHLRTTPCPPLLPQEHTCHTCASHRAVVMAVAKSKRNSTCQCPRRLRKNRWQVEDTTLRLAGGELGDRATKQPKHPLTDPCQAPLI